MIPHSVAESWTGCAGKLVSNENWFRIGLNSVSCLYGPLVPISRLFIRYGPIPDQSNSNRLRSTACAQSSFQAESGDVNDKRT